MQGQLSSEGLERNIGWKTWRGGGKYDDCKKKNYCRNADMPGMKLSLKGLT